MSTAATIDITTLILTPATTTITLDLLQLTRRLLVCVGLKRLSFLFNCVFRIYLRFGSRQVRRDLCSWHVLCLKLLWWLWGSSVSSGVCWHFAREGPLNWHAVSVNEGKGKLKTDKTKRETSELRHVTRSSVVCEPVVAVKQYGDSATAFWNPHGVFKYWWRFVEDTGNHRVKRCVTTQVHALCHTVK